MGSQNANKQKSIRTNDIDGEKALKTAEITIESRYYWNVCSELHMFCNLFESFCGVFL